MSFIIYNCSFLLSYLLTLSALLGVQIHQHQQSKKRINSYQILSCHNELLCCKLLK